MEAGGKPAPLVPRTFMEAQAFCAALAQSDLIPQRLKDRAPDVLVLVLAGIELGLTPLQSIRLHHVIEGIPRLSSSGIAAIVLSNPLCEYLRCTESSETRVTWVTKRRGEPERSCTWTIERAKRAGLTEKKNRDGSPGMWTKYPENMLSARSRKEVCEIVYPDIIAGLVSAEEAADGAIDAEFRDVPSSGFVEPAAPTTSFQGSGGAGSGSPRPSITLTATPDRRTRAAKDKPIEAQASERPTMPATVAPAQTPTSVGPSPSSAQTTSAISSPPPSPVVAPAADPAASPISSASPTAPSPSTDAGSSTTTASSSGAASTDDGFGGTEDPVDTVVAPPAKTMAGFHAWLASCKAKPELRANAQPWMVWRKQNFPDKGPEANEMSKAYSKRMSEVPE